MRRRLRLPQRTHLRGERDAGRELLGKLAVCGLEDLRSLAHIRILVRVPVCKTVLHALLGGEPGLAVLHLHQLLGRELVPCFGEVRLAAGGVDLVQILRSLAQLISVAHGAHPHVVDHHHCVAGHDDLICRHGDDGCDRAGEAVDVRRFVCRVPTQLVIDGSALENGAAVGVDVEVDLLRVWLLSQRIAQGVGAGLALFGIREPPARVVALDVAVDVEVERAGRCGLLEFPHTLMHHCFLLP